MRPRPNSLLVIDMTTYLSMLNLTCFLLFMNIINQQSASARLLGDQPPHRHQHATQHLITFFMPDVLSGTQPWSRPATTTVNGQLPFPKPVGLFPPIGGIPLPEPNPTLPATGLSTQTLDISGMGLSFPAVATLQELEFGKVAPIHEELSEGSELRSPLVGKAQGVYVASSEDGSCHMMAMTAMFANDEFKDSLRFFGVHQTDVSESHIAVIGGTGRYNGANGYATVQAVTDGSMDDSHEGGGSKRLLKFTVYFTY